MDQQSSTTQVPPVAPATEQPVKRTRAKRESFTVGAIANQRAKQRGISADKAAKEVRGILRANFEVVCKLDPTIVRAKDRANDGNRWPAMNDSVRKYVVDRSFRAAANAKHARRAK